MNARIVLPLIVCLSLVLDPLSASAQYTTRPGGGGQQAVADQVADAGSTGLGLAFVTTMSGDSLVRSPDDEDWAALSANLSLRIGDRIWVQDGGMLEVRFPLGATAWVNYQSELDITRMARGAQGDTIQLALVSGEGAFDVKGFGQPGSVFQVDLPSASIRATRAARFRVNTLPDGTAQIGVISGSVDLETPDGLTEVSGGQMAEIQPDRRVMLDFLPPSDAWDGWVHSRAELYARPATSVRYLPADLTPYAHEFDSSGRWVNDRTHGYIWVPVVDRGWSPYSNGRWVWQANDYVWLGYDPWYAPFHYGRWSWGASIGWYWIAPRGRAYWSPGYVGWSISGDEVYWVPLGYNEVYYGYGNYGPRNVNVYKTTNINITNIYINSRVTNGVVAVRRDNFLRGKIARERIALQRNPFERGGRSGPTILGRAPVQEIKPIRETRHSRPEIAIKRNALPPAHLEKQSQTIKTRGIAPTNKKSAFKPGNKPAQLKNIIKDKQLEQWVPPKKGKAPRERVTPGKSTEQLTQPGVQGRQVQPPVGKRQFKRVPEPQGGVNMPPAQGEAPEKREQGGQGRQPFDEERTQGGGRGQGPKK